MNIKQAIIPAAGLGTRFLPVTKSIPKELLPLLDKPCIQYVIDEAIEAGVEEIIIIISKEKKLIKSHLTKNDFLNQLLIKRGLKEYYENIKNIETKATYRFVIQDEPLGLGHAILQAYPYIKGDYFFILLPDDIISSTIPTCEQMKRAFSLQEKPLVATMNVPLEQVNRYGIVVTEPSSHPDIAKITDIIEKPNQQEAPTNQAIIGRYLLSRDIFTFLDKTEKGENNEIHLTDALKQVMASKGLQAFSFSGIRLDTGTPAGLFQAAMILAKTHPQFQNALSL